MAGISTGSITGAGPWACRRAAQTQRPGSVPELVEGPHHELIVSTGSTTGIGMYVLISMLFIAQGIILPVLYATIIAILINPLVNYLVKQKINRVLAITGVLLLSSALFY